MSRFFYSNKTCLLTIAYISHHAYSDKYIISVSDIILFKFSRSGENAKTKRASLSITVIEHHLIVKQTQLFSVLSTFLVLLSMIFKTTTVPYNRFHPPFPSIDTTSLPDLNCIVGRQLSFYAEQFISFVIIDKYSNYTFYI